MTKSWRSNSEIRYPIANKYIKTLILGGLVLRWRRNRMGRPLSPSKIHQKNISMLSKFHKTTSECWQRTSGTQQSRSLASKTGRKKYNKMKKETKEVGREREGNPVVGRDS